MAVQIQASLLEPQISDASPSGTRRTIPAISILRSADYQPREGLNDEAILRYRELLQLGSEPPPIEVIPSGPEKYLLVHGNHRLESQLREGRTKIEAIVLDLSPDEAVVRASVANGTNDGFGVPLRIEEKRVAAERVLRLIPRLPHDHEFRQGRNGEHGAIAPIAKSLGLATETVRNLKRQILIEPEVNDWLDRYRTPPKGKELYLYSALPHHAAGKVAQAALLEPHVDFPCEYVGSSAQGLVVQFRQPKVATFTVFPHNLEWRQATRSRTQTFGSLKAELDDRARALGLSTSRQQVLPTRPTRDAVPPDEDDIFPFVTPPSDADAPPATDELPTRRERVANDYYPTPEAVTHALIDTVFDHLTLGKRWLECCDGHGAISKVLKKRKPFLKVKTNEPFPPQACMPDYLLDATDPASWDRFCEPYRPEWTITNPPFSLVDTIVPLAFENSKRGAIVLLRMSWIEQCETRRDWLFENVDRLRFFIPVNPRIKFRTDVSGSDSVTCAWFVFDKGWSWRQHGVVCPFQFITDWKGGH